jgi:hypothetical protein
MQVAVTKTAVGSGRSESIAAPSAAQLRSEGRREPGRCEGCRNPKAPTGLFRRTRERRARRRVARTGCASLVSAPPRLRAPIDRARCCRRRIAAIAAMPAISSVAGPGEATAAGQETGCSKAMTRSSKFCPEAGQDVATLSTGFRPSTSTRGAQRGALEDRGSRLYGLVSPESSHSGNSSSVAGGKGKETIAGRPSVPITPLLGFGTPPQAVSWLHGQLQSGLLG